VVADSKGGTPRPAAKKKIVAKAVVKKAPVKKAPAKKTAPTKEVKKVVDQPVVLSAKEAKANNKELITRLGKAAKGAKDDLKVIKGIGPKLEQTLNSLGITSYAQVAKMKVRDYDLVDSLLTNFKGRGKRDEWSKQAKKLK